MTRTGFRIPAASQPASRPSSPGRRAATWGRSGSTVRTTSAAASAGEPATLPPEIALAFAAVRFQRVSGTPPPRMFLAMGAPIGPVPNSETDSGKPGNCLRVLVGVVMSLEGDESGGGGQERAEPRDGGKHEQPEEDGDEVGPEVLEALLHGFVPRCAGNV